MTYTSLSSTSVLHHRAGWQQITHIAHGLMTFSLKHGVTTVITGSSSPKFRRYPAAGHAIKHCARIHVYVKGPPERVIYYLMKHPQLPPRKAEEARSQGRKTVPATPPLSFFFDELIDLAKVE